MLSFTRWKSGIKACKSASRGSCRESSVDGSLRNKDTNGFSNGGLALLNVEFAAAAARIY